MSQCDDILQERQIENQQLLENRFPIITLYSSVQENSIITLLKIQLTLCNFTESS